MTDFRMLRVFNDDAVRGYAGAKARLGMNSLPHFQGDSLAERVIRELAHERALPVKEVVEAFEFFAVVRKYLRRSPHIVDLCSGHGLAGILFAIHERRTETVTLCDQRKPERWDRLWGGCLRAAPWIEGRVEYVEGKLTATRACLPRGAGFLGVHACGKLSDLCIDIAAEQRGPLAIMPCCRAHAHNPAPVGLRQALGEDVAYDVDRTYALERHGYQVRWREIPAAITPMNRVLIAVPRRAERDDHVASS